MYWKVGPTGIADQMVAWGNRWGLVHVAAYGKSFGTASRDVWEMFIKQGMGRLLDNDLTGPICFMWGTTGGSVAALTAGPWVLLVNQEYFIAATIYAFLIGYFMVHYHHNMSISFLINLLINCR